MCKERTTHIKLNLKLNAHQSSVKINLLLLSQTFFPVDIAYKTTNYHVLIDTVRFQGYFF